MDLGIDELGGKNGLQVLQHKTGCYPAGFFLRIRPLCRFADGDEKRENARVARFPTLKVPRGYEVIRSFPPARYTPPPQPDFPATKLTSCDLRSFSKSVAAFVITPFPETSLRGRHLYDA